MSDLHAFKQHGRAGHGRGADEFTAVDDVFYHFFRTANLLYWASNNAPATSADVDAQIGHAVVRIDQYQADRERDEEQSLHKQ